MLDPLTEPGGPSVCDLVQQIEGLPDEGSSIRPSLALLDIESCPKRTSDDLNAVLHRLKRQRVPVIGLSEADPGDACELLDLWVTRTITPADLGIAIRAVLRREKPACLDQLLAYESLLLNEREQRVTFEGLQFKLGRKEFLFLALMMEAPDRVWRRETLRDYVWNHQVSLNARTIDKTASRVRAALLQATGRHFIDSVNRKGYKLSSR